jgi:nucleoside-diphosphate-sugar epimerase
LNKYRSKIDLQWGDITNIDDVEKVCMNKDVVIHLAAIIPPLADKKPGLAKRVNIDGTKNMIASLELFSPGAFLLYASSISVYGDRIDNPDIRVGDELKSSDGDYYAITKLETEAAIRASRLEWSIFRLTFISGVKNHKISPLMFHQPLPTQLELATPEDTARAFIRAIEKKYALMGKTFNLGGGENCRIRYDKFLARMFNIYGLGKVNFPKNAFARKNFHCGFYMDGDILENILHFRQDSVESYFSRVKNSIPKIQRFFTKIFCPAIKRSLLNQSEPLKAIKKNNLLLIYRFFGKTLKNEV